MSKLDDMLEEISRRHGYIPPIDEGFWGEMGKGVAKTFVSGVEYTGKALQELDDHPIQEERTGYGLEKWAKETLDSNHQWDRPYNMGTMSTIGRFLGEGIFWDLPILLFVIYFVGKRLRKWSRRKLKIAKIQFRRHKQNCDDSRELALSELESGTLDKLTWANALIKAKGDEIKAKAEYLRIRRK